MVELVQLPRADASDYVLGAPSKRKEEHLDWDTLKYPWSLTD